MLKLLAAALFALISFAVTSCSTSSSSSSTSTATPGISGTINGTTYNETGYVTNLIVGGTNILYAAPSFTAFTNLQGVWAITLPPADLAAGTYTNAVVVFLTNSIYAVYGATNGSVIVTSYSSGASITGTFTGSGFLVTNLIYPAGACTFTGGSFNVIW